MPTATMAVDLRNGRQLSLTSVNPTSELLGNTFLDANSRGQDTILCNRGGKLRCSIQHMYDQDDRR